MPLGGLAGCLSHTPSPNLFPGILYKVERIKDPFCAIDVTSVS